jgi:HEAT repeat protein
MKLNCRRKFIVARCSRPWIRWAFLLACIASMTGMGLAQTPAKPDPDSVIVGDNETPPAVSSKATPAERSEQAWKALTQAMGDIKHPQTRAQALAALGLLRSPRSEKMIVDAMADQDVDMRTAAVLAAGQTKDRNLAAAMRKLLDDKEPQVVFTTAITLWKMDDKSGEDILMAVVDGERSANATLLHSTEHTANKDLHDPAFLTKMAALQGATMLLGPFGFGITAVEYVRQNGGDSSRVSAIEQIAQQHTEPVHKLLVAALADKDPTVRAASAKALVSYRDPATSIAIYGLLADTKRPVRLTAAAAYLRTTGVPGSSPGQDGMSHTSK